MATYTITSSINIDALVGKQGSDTYNINGGYLFVDQDSRHGLNQFSGSALGNISLSATDGGIIEFNATAVRLLAFNGASGLVPANNAIISSSNGASGSLIGVYPSLTSSTLITGSAMPTSGFLKLKKWNGITFSTGSLFGVAANSLGSDVAGWIEIAGVDAATATVNRLNSFIVRGDWYDLGMTSGTPSSSYQIPNNGQPIYVPGVWVESSSGSNAFEFYPNVGSGSITASIASDAVRGKYCWITNSGSIKFQPAASFGTGFLPSASLRVRVPNVFFTNCAAATRHINILPNATLATRYDFTTTGAGVIDIDKAWMSWYPSFNQPFSVKLTNTAIMSQLLVSEIASPISWSQVGVGVEAQNSQVALSMATCFAGGTISDSVFARANLTAGSAFVTTMTDISDFTFTDVKWLGILSRVALTTGAQTLTRVNRCTFNRNTFGGGGASIVTCSDLNYSGTIYYDHPSTTSFIQAMFAYSISANCARLKFDGMSFGDLNMVQPAGGILNVAAAGCADIQLRNMGTYNAPLDMGAAQRNAVSWSRVTTTATLTSTTHRLKVGDQIYVIQSGDTSAIAVGFKTVATVPTVNTVTFACTNAGATTGTLCYYPAVVASLFVLAAGAAANDVEVKRCYVPHLRTNLYTSDNSTKNIVLENVHTDFVMAPLVASLNTSIKGLASTMPLTAQTSVYGSHWFDMYVGDISPTTSSLAWSRVTTTATVTSSLHNLRTGEFVNVLTSSVTASILLGQKTITATSASYLTFTCLNAGATAGTLDMVNMSSRIGIQMNESTTDTATQYTEDAGTPGFTSAGGLSMPLVGAQVTFVTPKYILGYSGFQLTEAVMAGGTITNYGITYAIDKNDGLGYGSFNNLSYPRTGAGGSVGTQTITMTSTTGVAVGDYVFGTNVAPMTYVTEIVNATTIGVAIANIGAVSGILRFSRLPAEHVSPINGFKMQVRIKTSTAHVGAITSLYMHTKDSIQARRVQYPLDLVTVTLTNLKSPSEIRIFAAGTTTLIDGTENVVSGTYTTQLDGGSYPTIDIAILSLGYQNVRLLAQPLGTGLSIPVSQIIDRQYFNP